MVWAEDAEHKVLSPSTLSLIIDDVNLNTASLLQKHLSTFEVLCRAAVHKLLSYIPGLVAHIVISVDTLAQTTRGLFSATGT
jgi:hypothetical protein